jgi:hypothetical protein
MKITYVNSVVHILATSTGGSSQNFQVLAVALVSLGKAIIF